MQVRNKLNGNITSAPTNDNAIRAMIRLGILEVVGTDPGDMVRTSNGAVLPAMQPAPEPRWSVQMTTSGTETARFPAIVFEVGTTNYERFAGLPEDAQHGFGKRTVPDEIIKQYAKFHKDFYKNRK